MANADRLDVAGALMQPLALLADQSDRLVPPLTGVSYLDMLEEMGRRFAGDRYLEIGTQSGGSLARARGTCVSIDPAHKLRRMVGTLLKAGIRAAFQRRVRLRRMTSDDYFARHDAKADLGGPLQLAFIDGMHHYEYVLRDIHNCERNAAPDSILVLHDCIPWNFPMTRRLGRLPDGSYEPVRGAWTGDVWKVLPILAEVRPDLRVTLLDCPPTGLVAITGLDPSSTVLRDRHDALVAAREAEPDTQQGLVAWLSARRVLDTRRALASGVLAEALFGR